MKPAAPFPDGKTTAARAVQTQRVGLTMRLPLATGAGRSNALMRATNPTHVASIGMMTFIKPRRNKKPGKSGTTSNSGLPGGRIGRRARDEMTVVPEDRHTDERRHFFDMCQIEQTREAGSFKMARDQKNAVRGVGNRVHRRVRMPRCGAGVTRRD